MKFQKIAIVVGALLLADGVSAKSFEEKMEKKQLKMQKKMMKKQEKMEKKEFKHQKHLMKDKERIAEGEMPEHHEVIAEWHPDDAAMQKKLKEYEQHKEAKHAAKEERKAEKKRFKHEKHLIKDRERIAKGEMPEHHEAMEAGNAAPAGQDYKACVDYLNRRIQEKQFEQKKHTMKDQERIAKGEAPEHVGESSMTKDYRKDPKFDVNRVCGPTPKELQMQMLSEPASDVSICGLAFIAVLATTAAAAIAVQFRKTPSPAEEALLACEA